MRKLINLAMLLAMVFGLVATVRPQPVLALCEDGTSSSDILVCDTDPVPGVDNGDAQVDGDHGGDLIVITSDATVGAVDGDGAATGVGDTSDNPTTGDGGDDLIFIDGEVTDSVYGDYVVNGAGGDDIIIVNGYVDNGVIGDNVVTETAFGYDFIGGSDLIVIDESGDVGSVIGDGNINVGALNESNFYAGADSIFVYGYVEEFVAGDGDYVDAGCEESCGLHAEGGADQIYVGATGDTGPVMGEGSNFEVGCGFSCGISAYGGNDAITIEGVAYSNRNYSAAVMGDGIAAYVACEEDCGNYVEGGQDSIVLNGAAYGNVYGDGLSNFVDCYDYCGASTYGGDDQITINGEMVEAYVSGDGIETNDYAQGGNDTITINSEAYIIVSGDDIYAWSAQGGNDTIVVAEGATSVYGVQGDGIDAYYGQGGDDTIVVDGAAYYVVGDGMDTTVGEEIPLTGATECVTDFDCGGSLEGGDDTITINGVVGYVSGDYADGCAGDDTININGAVLYDVYGDDAYINCHSHRGTSGSDVVNIGAGGVTYGQVCGDVDVTTVDRRQGTVGGIIDGDYTINNAGYDALNFGLLTPSQDEADSLAAYLASLDPSGGSVVVNGQTYNYQNFEELNVYATLYTEGAQRMYDDGVTLAFAVADGIQVCNGPSGLKAGLIDYGRLTAGQREFGDNGFIVTLEDVGSQHFKVHVWKDGVEQFDDANEDGAADDLFVFGF